jgi:aspartate/methionine/tyrosine aminotransferase
VAPVLTYDCSRDDLGSVRCSIGRRMYGLVPLSTVELDHSSGWALDLDEVRRALAPDTRAIVVNFPHNPTGAHIDRSQLDAIIRICSERGIRLLSDEVYRLLEHERGATLPAAATLDDRAR